MVISTFSPDRRSSVVAEYTTVSAEAPVNIASLFKKNAEAYPTAAAIEEEGAPASSYGALDRNSDSLAQKLPTGGVVAICIERSTALITAMLAVLKSGSAYVILDPNGSEERNQFIVQDTGARCIITCNKYNHSFGDLIVVDGSVQLDTTGPNVKAGFTTQTINPSSPAYIIYTSGSSGKPKGVVISHRAAATGISHFSLNGKSRWLLFYNPIFSAAQRTMLATLCAGGTVCIASKERLATQLMDVVEGMRIDAIGITPSILTTLASDKLPASLKQITCVGEPVGRRTADAFSDKVEFRVSYGLSECAQLNFNRRLRKGDNPAVVGQPSDSTTAFVMVPGACQLAEDDEIGELCLSGPQLATGYLNLPDETSKAFTINPFSGQKMFRTGDSARVLSDGSFEIVGRLDNQIKINGQRVEPEEVSFVLSQHPGIAACSVVGVEINGTKALAAAIVPHQEKSWDKLVAAVRQLAQQSLPPYMIPSYWLRMMELPLSPNGKTKTTAVRAAIQSTAISDLVVRDGSLEQIDDAVEKKIQYAWASSLSLDPKSIGRSDKFFDLGGSSLQAIQMLNELRKEGIDLSLESIFRRDSIATLRQGASVPGPTPQHKRLGLLNGNQSIRQLDSQLDVADAFPATDFQESLVGLTLRGSTDYTYQRTWDVRHLDVARLRLAFHVAFLSSENLRTTFMSDASGMLQVIRNHANLPWSTSNLDINEFKREDLRRGFHLEQPFFRVALVRGGILVVTMHHALFDYWSHTFLYEDVARYYQGVAPLARPAFRDFVAYLAGVNWRGVEKYWKGYLQTAAPSVLNFAPTAETTVVQTLCSLDLKQVAGAQGVTLSTIIYTAWALVLAQHLGSNDVVFAVPLSGREAAIVDIDKMEGPTLTIAPIRYVLEPTMTVGEAVKTAYSQVGDILKHSQLGLRRILKASSQSSGLFDTMVNILPVRKSPTGTDAVFKVHGERQTWNTEYTTLQVEQRENGIALSLNTTMEKRRAEFIMEHFQRAVGMVSHQPHAAISSINMITGNEIELLSTVPPVPTELPETMLTLFDDMVAKYPYRTALQWQTIESITYDELDRRANQMARFLIHQGVAPGDFVCLLVNKSPMMIISILAILKARAAYVPMSPENPLERNAYIADEVEARIVISERDIEQASSFSSVLYLEDVDLSPFSASPLKQLVQRTDSSYIIYTSGSTGKPKGVLMTHGAVGTAIESLIRREDRRHGHWRTLQFTNYIFDASVYEIFTTLGSGATLCVAPMDKLLSNLAGAINEMFVTHCFMTPTVARLTRPSEVPHMRTLTVGGEAVTADVLDAWGDHCQVFQAYGPTETAMIVTDRDMGSARDTRNLGTLFDTAPGFIVQRDGAELVPYGAVGELCIAGPQLGLGYMKRPDLTAAAFVDTTIAGFSRMYRTGDLARWLPGGQIEYLGRKDHQVKVNGHRIELGEIESAMMATGEITDCVTVVASIDGKPQLVSFIVFEPAEGEGVQAPEPFVDAVAALKGKISGLAHYMHPKAVLPLAAMPLMPSGKSNRKLLASWILEIDAAELSRYYFDCFGGSGAVVATESPAEKFLEEAFAVILKVDSSQLGKNANFLALGGDSISAINLTSFARKGGYELSVSTVLKFSRLQDMALHLGVMRDNTDSETSTIAEFAPPDAVHKRLALVGVTEEQVDYIYPCPPGQAEFLSQGSRETQDWVLMTVRPFPAHHDIHVWIKAIEKLTEVNDILRTTFTRHDGAWYGVVLNDTKLVMEHVDVANDEEKKAHVDRIFNTPFTFGRPFIRYASLRHPDGRTDLAVKMDHALYDGTLLRIFKGHLAAIQHGTPLPELSLFRDYAMHMHATPASTRAAALDFFTRQRRPTGIRPFPAIARPAVGRKVFVADDSATGGIEELARGAGVTPSIVFQTAFGAWLARRDGRASKGDGPGPAAVSYDTLYTGRNVALADPQAINGCTANFLPFRAPAEGTGAAGGAGVRAALRATQDEFWATTEHGVVRLGDIFDAAGLDRETYGNTSLFLFQPFEPPAAGNKKAEADMGWVVMAGSEVRMVEPYALVVEVHKTLEGYKFKIGFDERAMGDEDARGCGREMWGIVKGMVAAGLDGKLEDCL